MMFRLMPAFVFFLLMAVLLVPLLTGKDPAQIDTGMRGKSIPVFTLAGLSQADLKGKVSVVNFFASWCVPCTAEHPVLVRLAKDSGVDIYGIAYKDKPADTQKWLDKHGNPYTKIAADPDGKAAIEWGVYGVPETFVIDRDGVIRLHHAGPLTQVQYHTEILPMVERLRR